MEESSIRPPTDGTPKDILTRENEVIGLVEESLADLVHRVVYGRVFQGPNQSRFQVLHTPLGVFEISRHDFCSLGVRKDTGPGNLRWSLEVLHSLKDGGLSILLKL